MKRTLRVDRNINPDVKVGDKIKLTNAETLTHMLYEGDFDLLRKYPMLGIHETLDVIVGTVITTGITDFVVERDGKYVTYVQDIIVKVSGNMFRTSSRAVRTLKTPLDLIDGRLGRLKAFKTRSKKVQRDIQTSIELLESLRDDINNHK